jgi:mRNA-degrading endonuclease toxin of MazEF toxin-antitoxin module
MMGLPQRGEVWWCEPPDIGRRPVVVLSRDVAMARMGRLSDRRMLEVCAALAVATNCE